MVVPAVILCAQFASSLVPRIFMRQDTCVFLTSTNARKMQHNNGSACQAVETKSTDVEYWSLPYSSLMLLASILHAAKALMLSTAGHVCLHCFTCLPHDSGHNAKELVNGDVRVPQHRSK